MFKDRSKIFFFTIIVECILSFAFLISSSLRNVISRDAQAMLTTGTLFSYLGVGITGILLVIGTVLNTVGFGYKKKDLMTVGTVLVMVTLVADFFGTLLIICFEGIASSNVVCGSIFYLMEILIIVVVLMIAFDDQMKLLKEKKSK